MGETVVEAEEVTGLIRGQQMEHKYKLMISYRTSSKNKAELTTAIMIMLMTQSLIESCLNKASQLIVIAVVHDVSFVTNHDSSANCTNTHVKANPNCMVNHSVNATSAINVCIDSHDLKASVQISIKTKCVNMQFIVDTGADSNLLPLDLYHRLYPNVTAKSLQKDQSVNLFACNGSEIQYFCICSLQVHF